MPIEQTWPSRVFRFFKELDHAEALCAGKVWISTLEACRGYEDPKQGDKNEGTLDYLSGRIEGDMSDPNFRVVAARSGVEVSGDSRSIVIENVYVPERIPDGYVLCFTEKFDPEVLSQTFGRFCVEVRGVRDFFEMTSSALRSRIPIAQEMVGRVVYESRMYVGTARPSGRIGFVKEPDQYADQNELRFVWLPRGLPKLAPLVVEVPGASRHCRRVA